MVNVVVVNHLPDGSTATRVWHIDPERVDELTDWLGEPDVEQYLTVEQSAAVDGIGGVALYRT